MKETLRVSLTVIKKWRQECPQYYCLLMVVSIELLMICFKIILKEKTLSYYMGNIPIVLVETL